MFNVSGWVRRLFRDAALNGIGDAMKAITPEGEEPPATVEEMRAMLAAAVQPKALPAAKEEEEPAKRKGR